MHEGPEICVCTLVRLCKLATMHDANPAWACTPCCMAACVHSGCWQPLLCMAYKAVQVTWSAMRRNQQQCNESPVVNGVHNEQYMLAPPAWCATQSRYCLNPLPHSDGHTPCVVTLPLVAVLPIAHLTAAPHLGGSCTQSSTNPTHKQIICIDKHRVWQSGTHACKHNQGPDCACHVDRSWSTHITPCRCFCHPLANMRGSNSPRMAARTTHTHWPAAARHSPCMTAIMHTVSGCAREQAHRVMLEAVLQP